MSDDRYQSAASLQRLDKRHVWHPFTHMQQWLDGEPLVIVEGSGCKLKDSSGRWYWDATSSIWLNVHGHRVSAIDAAIRQQLDRVAHSTLLGLANDRSIELCTELAARLPGDLERVFLADSGSGAVEAALKIAVQYHANRGHRGRRFILGFSDNYHGDTLGAVGVAPDQTFHGAYLDLLPGHPRVAFPRALDGEVGLEESLAQARQVLESRAAEMAAIIVEPVQGAGGIIVPPPGFLRRLRELADDYDLLLIVDEVATGCCRTGPFVACTTEGITPDLITLGKGLTGGYLPVSATITRPQIFETFLGPVDSGRTFFHGHSYTGNNLGCAAALANLELLAELEPQLPPRIAQITEGLTALSTHPHIGEIRQAGFMVGLELVKGREGSQPFDYTHQAGHVVADTAKSLGLLIRPIGNVLIFMPPLGASEADLATMLELLIESFQLSSPRLSELASTV